MGALKHALNNKVITHLTGANNYTLLHYEDGTSELFSKTLRYFDDLLPGFIRIHKIALVNPRFIRSIRAPAKKKMSGWLITKTGQVLPISRRRFSLVTHIPIS